MSGPLDQVTLVRRALDQTAHALNAAMLDAYDHGCSAETVAAYGRSTASHVRMLVLARADSGHDPADALTPADEAP